MPRKWIQFLISLDVRSRLSYNRVIQAEGDAWQNLYESIYSIDHLRVYNLRFRSRFVGVRVGALWIDLRGQPRRTLDS